MKVVVIWALVFGDLIRQTLLSLLPFLRLAFKKRGFNKTIKAIFVKLIETILNLAMLCLELSDRLIPESLFIGVALMQSFGHSVHNFVVKDKAFQQISEALFQNFFARVGLLTFPLVAGAVIVNVLAFLLLGYEGATAMSAADQAREGKLVFRQLLLSGKPPVENLLNTLEKFCRD